MNGLGPCPEHGPVGVHYGYACGHCEEPWPCSAIDPLGEVMEALSYLTLEHALRVLEAARCRVEALTPENL